MGSNFWQYKNVSISGKVFEVHVVAPVYQAPKS